jgi:hypothetical protein
MRKLIGGTFFAIVPIANITKQQSLAALLNQTVVIFRRGQRRRSPFLARESVG